MKRFEYEITTYPADEIMDLVYFCTAEGECSFKQLPSAQAKKLVEILNREGSEGWDLVQIFFGKDGVVAFWKRAI